MKATFGPSLKQLALAAEFECGHAPVNNRFSIMTFGLGGGGGGGKERGAPNEAMASPAMTIISATSWREADVH